MLLDNPTSFGEMRGVRRAAVEREVLAVLALPTSEDNGVKTPVKASGKEFICVKPSVKPTRTSKRLAAHNRSSILSKAIVRKSNLRE